jgi:hypothetical protein
MNDQNPLIFVVVFLNLNLLMQLFEKARLVSSRLGERSRTKDLSRTLVGDAEHYMPAAFVSQSYAVFDQLLEMESA